MGRKVRKQKNVVFNFSGFHSFTYLYPKILELSLGNIARNCRHGGISFTSFRTQLSGRHVFLVQLCHSRRCIRTFALGRRKEDYLRCRLPTRQNAVA
eukprot:171493-Amorphochlora_amoeboformis.AAC.1